MQLPGVATSKDSDLQLYPFKFPPLKPEEVRLKILHTSICSSDVMTLRGKWANIWGNFGSI